MEDPQQQDGRTPVSPDLVIKHLTEQAAEQSLQVAMYKAHCEALESQINQYKEVVDDLASQVANQVKDEGGDSGEGNEEAKSNRKQERKVAAGG